MALDGLESKAISSIQPATALRSLRFPMDMISSFEDLDPVGTGIRYDVVPIWIRMV